MFLSEQYSQAWRGNLIGGASGRLKAIQQRMSLGGIGALRAAEMAHVMALAHELSGRQLHRGARGRRETSRHVREPGDQLDRCDQEAEPNTWTDRLAERIDVNDASIAVERGERWRGPARQLQLAQIVVLDHPDLARRRPVEQSKAPFKREGGAERRLLAGGHENELGLGMVAQSVIDIDTAAISS